MENLEIGTMKCQVCGKDHQKSTSNCCWINCSCRHSICGQCGSANLHEMEMSEDDDEAQYWCCLKCGDCGLEGCAMCI